MTVIHIILMAPYIQTNNEELYLYNNDVTYYVITCNSAFEYNNDVTYYVITRNYQWTPEILTNNLLEAGCTNKLCPLQYKVSCILYLVFRITQLAACNTCHVNIHVKSMYKVKKVT